MSKEQWRPIARYDGLYLVSDCGHVKDARDDQALPMYPDKDGYQLVHFKYEGKRYTEKVHRLVAEAFIPNTDGKPTVNHINEVKDDNRVSNLEWATYLEQIHHGTRDERAMESIDTRPVMQLAENGDCVGRYESVRNAARVVGRKPEAIVDCLKGRSQKCAGFRWIYETPETPLKTGREKNRPVAQIDFDGATVCIHPSVQAAARSVGISPSGICLCIGGKRRTAGGFRWKYDETGAYADYEDKQTSDMKIPILQFDADGNFLNEFDSVTAAAKAVRRSTGEICRCLKGRRKTCGGYQWRYA